MKKIFLCLCVLLSLDSYADISAKVLSIHDGDTITATVKGAKLRVRLLGVDSPEVDFNGYSQGEVAIKARDYLRSLVPIEAEVLLKTQKNSLDGNGRMLAQIFYKGQDINYMMLKSGWAAMYFIYPFDKKIVSDYSQASNGAELSKLGSFSIPYLHEPVAYIFRQSKKGFPGNNFVADFKLKKIFTEIESIPAHRRVFFPSEEIALSQGYHW